MRIDGWKRAPRWKGKKGPTESGKKFKYRVIRGEVGKKVVAWLDSNCLRWPQQMKAPWIPFSLGSSPGNREFKGIKAFHSLSSLLNLPWLPVASRRFRRFSDTFGCCCKTHFEKPESIGWAAGKCEFWRMLKDYRRLPRTIMKWLSGDKP